MQILLVEDNDNIIKGLEYAFKKIGYKFLFGKNIKEAKDILNKVKPDIIILDISLPDGDGLNFFETFIKNKNIPVIILTACDDEDRVVEALNDGCDDYITKPFSTRELIARIERTCSRNKSKSIVKSHDVEFDLDKMIIKKNDIMINVSSLELKILSLLFSNINKVVKREAIIEHIWEWTGNDVDDHTITVYLNRIRQKIGPNIIITIKGVGYRIDGD